MFKFVRKFTVEVDVAQSFDDSSVKTRLRNQNLSLDAGVSSNSDENRVELTNGDVSPSSGQVLGSGLDEESVEIDEKPILVNNNSAKKSSAGGRRRKVLTDEQQDQLFRVLHSCEQEGISINKKLLAYASKQILMHSNGVIPQISDVWAMKKLCEYRRKTF